MQGIDDSKRCGVGIRGVAMGIDSVVWFSLFLVAVIAVGAVTGQVESTPSGLDAELEGTPATMGLVLWFGLTIAYHTLFEWLFGRTLGKHLVRIRVVSRDGSRPSLLGSLVRNLLRFVDWLPLCYLLGISTIVSSDRKQRVGDRLGRTLVVRY